MQQDFLNIFLEEATDTLQRWESVVIEINESNWVDSLKDLFRMAHNMKGAAQSVEQDEFATIIHQVETVVEKYQALEQGVDERFKAIMLEAESVLSKILENLQSSSPVSLELDGFSSKLKQLNSDLNYEDYRSRGTPYYPSESGETSQAGQASEIEGLTMFSEEPAAESASGSLKEAATTSASTDTKEKTAIETGEGSKKVQASKPGAASANYIKVSLERLDTLINYIGELMVDQSFLHEKRQKIGNDPAILRTISKLSKNITEIRSVAMSLRMIPISGLFQKQKRIVWDAAKSVGKDIEFEVDGDWVEVDKMIIDDLGSPLSHLLRNAVDHGIEDAERRREIGKPEKGTVSCRALYQDDQIQLIVEDDGGGLDPDRIWEKAMSKGLVKPDDPRPSDEKVFDLIFKAGFSTRDTVDQLSGRGVGMEVVHKTITDLKGTIQIQSVKEVGTRFTLNLPLSLSIVQGLVVRVQDERFVIPVSQLVKTIHFHNVATKPCNKYGRMAVMKDGVIPLISVSEIFGFSTPVERLEKKPKMAVVIADGAVNIALEVDQIIGQQSVVLKPLTPDLLEVPGLMAGAILNDGDPSLVLYLPGLKDSWRVSHAA